MKKPFIAFNWKCNPSSNALVLELLKASDREGSVVFPSFVDLSEAGKKLRKASLGAQDLFVSGGAYTGEVSPKMLKRLGVSYVLVGHSERRSFIGEADYLVREKMESALLSGLRPILCIGETADERAAGIGEEIIERQFLSGTEKISPELLKKIIVAYEPVWAISTGTVGTAASPEDASRAAMFIKRLAMDINIPNVSVLYGGSASSANAAGFLSAREVDGLLIGGASLKPLEVKAILDIAFKGTDKKKNKNGKK